MPAIAVACLLLTQGAAGASSVPPGPASAHADSVKRDTARGATAHAPVSAAVNIQSPALDTSLLRAASGVTPRAVETAASPPRRHVLRIRATVLKVARRIPHLVPLLLACGVILVTAAFYATRAGRKPANPGKRFMSNTRLSIMDKEVRRACRYIEQQFRDPELTVATICRGIVTGEAFLEALFERELGMSVGSYLDHVRINWAQAHLQTHPGASADEVAGPAGFSETAEFMRVFQRVTGSRFGGPPEAAS